VNKSFRPENGIDPVSEFDIDDEVDAEVDADEDPAVTKEVVGKAEPRELVATVETKEDESTEEEEEDRL